MKKALLFASAAAMAFGALPAAAQTYVGSFWVGDGPLWSGNPTPQVYSALDVAAMLFGGSASDYAISIDQSFVTYTAWVDGYGDTSHLKTDWFNSSGGPSGTPVAEDYSLGDANGQYTYPSFSAYVLDHEQNTTRDSEQASINYVFRLDSTTVPEPATWGLMILGFGAVGGAMRRRRATVAFA